MRPCLVLPFRSSVSVSLVVLSLAHIACKEVSLPVVASEEFTATLSGANQVPPVTTTASGSALFAVSLDTFLTFRVEVAALDTPTVAYLQEGAAGDTGAIILTLYPGPTRNTVGYTGPLVGTGTTVVTTRGGEQRVPSQLTQLPASYGATPRARFDALVARMRAGTVYVNVRSRRNPSGELRGQVN